MKCNREHNIILLCYFIFLISRNVLALNSCESSSNSCEECIVDSSKCVWCAMVNFNDTRCRSEKDNLDNWCVGNIINPKSGNRSDGKDLDFNSNTGEVVQIKPQNIKIDLRPGDTFDFAFSIKPVENYPVDLYFLVDASVEMKKVKQIVVDETEAIYRAMKNMTEDVFLGTGSFIDKNIFPFTRSVNSTIAYSFRNRLKLTDKFEYFQKTVNETEFGYNHDDQEGTLDALAQVITCENEIGWRKESTKIIIVLTDGPYHCAGDGKWAGIYRPYDGNCYTEDGIYKNELVMDYPSVSIINKLAADREIIIIFVVKEDQESVYNALSTTIRGSVVTLFESDTSEFSMNKILTTQYENIRHQLKLKVNYMDPILRQHFRISFDPNCYESICQIKPGEEKEFRGKITLIQNIEPNNVDIDILTEGIREKLNLNVNIIKKCNCTVETDSVECDSAGTLRCGICECKPERYGHKCKCERKSKSIKPNDNSTCISPTSPDKICSGFGACDCGKCSCINNDYTGTFCECHKNMCPLYNDLVCSDNGDCKCGTCYCHAGFTGAACDCILGKDTCMDGNTECNNRGKCVCGSCQCQEPSDWDARHKGDLCRLDCTEKSCHSHQCQLLEPIVLCYLNKEECQHQNEINVTGVKNLKANDSTNDVANYSENGWQHCPNVKTGFGCYTEFLYRYSEDIYGTEVKVQTDISCAETYYMYGGICLSILILSGIIALITWKCITSMRDRQEYERFAQEAGILDSPCDNPIYAPATSTFYNPGFRKRSDRRKSRS
ncbi:integrin beta pat-3-like [Maniola jurtina]|uniref:integrin beta pat-3-like n=1 Tax=Maniola jurtina TaxID=191418 RepID=UPI001E687570|nr:integrin beta pat-3-like [Maniola jurtina]